MTTSNIISLSVAAAVCAASFILRFALKMQDKKKAKTKNLLTLLCGVVAAWYFVGTLLNVLSGKNGISLSIPEFEMFSERIGIFGVSVAKTTFVTYIMIGVVLVLSLVFRIFFVPRFDLDRPTCVQNVFEALTEACESFVKGVVGDELGDGIVSYMYAVAVFMMGCALTELFGQRAPTSDLVMTFSLALCTFFLINFYGIRKKGVFGRIKSLASPSPMMFPMKILSDCAVPVSLACRLFGNMLGGMIVLDLLKSSLGAYAFGIPAVAGLYFNLFHPLIQTYIFIILSLTFINEAVE